MRVIFMGTPDFSVSTLQALWEAGHEIVGVVSQPDKPKGRGKALMPTPVKAAALEKNLPVYQPQKVREEAFLAQMEQLHPDVVVAVAFGQMIPERILNLAPLGCINVHASLLPAYRGAAPIQWALMDGLSETGVTIMRMDAGLDTGDIIAKTVVPIGPEETSGSLFDQLSQAGAKLLVKTLPLIASGEAVYEKQPKESPTPYASMITKAMGNLDWSQSALKLERLIRAMNPWPSAYTRLGKKTLKIWKAKALPQSEPKETPCGAILQADAKGLRIQTGQGVLQIEELQLEGKKRMDTQAFLRGCPLEAGTQLG